MSAVVDDEDGGNLMASAAFNGGDDGRLRGGGKAAGAKRKTQTQQSNGGGGGHRTPSDAFRRAKRRWQGVCEISAMVPQWGYGGCSVVGAAAVVHPWGAGGGVVAHRCWRGVSGAFQRAGRWLWRWRQHVNGTMVGAFLGRRVVAAHPWVGGGVLAMVGCRRHWRQLVGNNSTTNLTVVEVEARQRQQ